jgi:Putative TOS1-like glycosyl hydrolase (DUF2401)/Glycine-rich protein domain (DUF2403)
MRGLAAPACTALLVAACSTAPSASGGGPGGDDAATDDSGADATSAGGADARPPPTPALDAGLDAPDLGNEDPASNGGTITFQSIGAAGWFPSRRDPATGPCDAFQSATCCLAKATVTSDALTPWDEDLILTLRGPMLVEELAVYQPDAAAGAWKLVSAWDGAAKGAGRGLAFDGNGTETSGFAGAVGTECLVNVATSQPFACGAGSSPYCPPPAAGKSAHLGWSGSKLFVILAKMPHADQVPNPCSKTTTGNWYDAPWIGLSVGELVRAGSFVSCQCYAKDQAKGYLADGCGQFNVFEVVNDNGAYKNLDVFSTDMIDYAGYVGEGPCGPKCDVTKLGAAVDLIDKSTDTEAKAGAVSSPTKGPGAAFRRPENGYRYFLVLLDVPTRTVQLAIVHPLRVPASLAALLPSAPATLGAATIDAVRALRLPN